MEIGYIRYVIGTKERPTMFVDEYGNAIDDVELAALFRNENEADEEIKKYDTLDLLIPYKVRVTIEEI